MNAHRSRRWVAAATAAAGIVTGTLSAAAPASAATVAAGSIVYVKNANVWIMKGDGSHAHALTTNGTATLPYRTPSEADTGTVAAARGNLIVTMTQTGTPLTSMDPPGLKNSVGNVMDGPPTEVAISPDGTLIAWSFAWYECPPAATCGVRQVTGYTASDHLTDPKLYGSTVYGMPSWAGKSTRTLQTGISQVQIQDLTKPSFHWFYDSDYASNSTDLSDAELSDDGRQLAIVRGYGNAMTVLWFTVTGNAKLGTAPPTPSPNCITNASPNVTSPTWAPAGAALAYGYPEGIYVVNDPLHCGAQAPKLVAAGGSHPDWSKATLK